MGVRPAAVKVWFWASSGWLMVGLVLAGFAGLSFSAALSKGVSFDEGLQLAVGYKLLVDSSLDWGMDLPHLKRWLEDNNPGNREPVFLSYFGTDSVRHHGIKAVMLPSFRPWRESELHSLKPGIYAVSATLFQGNYTPTFGRWNAAYEQIYQAKLRSVLLIEEAIGDPERRAALRRTGSLDFWRGEYRTYDYFRFGRLCAWLRQRGNAPVQVGYSILIWRLSYAELHAALYGPPPEMGTIPADWLALMGLPSADNLAGFQVILSAPSQPGPRK